MTVCQLDEVSTILAQTPLMPYTTKVVKGTPDAPASNHVLR